MISKSSAPPTAQECTIWLSHLRQSFWFLRHKCGISGKIRFNYTCNEIISFFVHIVKQDIATRRRSICEFFVKNDHNLKAEAEIKEKPLLLLNICGEIQKIAKVEPGEKYLFIFTFLRVWKKARNPLWDRAFCLKYLLKGLYLAVMVLKDASQGSQQTGNHLWLSSDNQILIFWVMKHNHIMFALPDFLICRYFISLFPRLPSFSPSTVSQFATVWQGSRSLYRKDPQSWSRFSGWPYNRFPHDDGLFPPDGSGSS